MTVPALAQDDAPIVIAPSTPWEVNFADAKCRAVRIFGEGDERTILFLEQITPSDSPRWVMAGKAAKELDSGGDLSVQFGPEIDPWEMRAEKGTTLGEFGPAFRGSSIRKPDRDWKAWRLNEKAEPDEPEVHVGLSMLDPEEGSAIEWVEFGRGDHRPFRLATGSFGQLFEILNTCMTDLVRTWGVDVEAQARRAKAPHPLNIEQIARRIQQYYPSRAADWGKQADLVVRMLIDKNGDVTDCKITNVSKAEDFDDRACIEFSKVGKFEPAYDVDGQPMDSFYATTVLYRLN